MSVRSELSDTVWLLWESPSFSQQKQIVSVYWIFCCWCPSPPPATAHKRCSLLVQLARVHFLWWISNCVVGHSIQELFNTTDLSVAFSQSPNWCTVNKSGPPIDVNACPSSKQAAWPQKWWKHKFCLMSKTRWPAATQLHKRFLLCQVCQLATLLSGLCSWFRTTCFWRLRPNPWFLPKHLATPILTELSKLLSCSHHDLKKKSSNLTVGMARLWFFGWASQMECLMVGSWSITAGSSQDSLLCLMELWSDHTRRYQKWIMQEHGNNKFWPSSPISEFWFAKFLSIGKLSVEKVTVTLQVKVIPNTSLTFPTTRTHL